MPPFQRHSAQARRLAAGVLPVAWLVGVVLLDVTYASLLAPAAALASYVGGVAPDLDCHCSVPRRRFERGVRVGGGCALSAVLLFWARDCVTVVRSLLDALGIVYPPGVLVGLGIGVVVTGYLRVISPLIAASFPRHRGRFHRLSVWAAITLVLNIGGVLAAPPSIPTVDALLFGAVIGGAYLAGIGRHLAADDELKLPSLRF